MENKQIEILTSQKEDFERDIDRVNNFIYTIETSELPIQIKNKVNGVVSEELQGLEFYREEIENDLRTISVDVGSLVNNELTAQEEDFLIEAELEQMRERREH